MYVVQIVRSTEPCSVLHGILRQPYRTTGRTIFYGAKRGTVVKSTTEYCTAWLYS